VIEARRSACPLDCPDGCSLQVAVDDGRLVSVDAAPEAEAVNPLTQGYICHKVKHHARRVYAPERVLDPLVRKGDKGAGEFVPIGWDDALDLVAARVQATIDRYGPAAVVPYLYSSSAGKLARRALSPLLWRALGTSEVERTICAATASAAWELTFGDLPGADLFDVEAAQLVVVWGANPTVSNTHFLPLVTAARRNGARLVVIDPRRTAMAASADLHLAVRPGTDVVLAMGIAAELDRRQAVDRSFVGAHAAGVDEYLEACRRWDLARVHELTGVESEVLDQFVELLVSRRPTFFRVGFGLERNRNGGAAHRSVLALSVLVGAFGERGAGVHLDTGDSPWRADALVEAVLGAEPPPPARLLNMNELGRNLTDTQLEPPVSVLFVQGANPAVTAPDQGAVLAGLARHDLFTVVHDQVLTDTARFADVVLPATTHFEAADVQLPYGAFTIDRFDPVIERVGQSRTNDEVTAGLAVRLGLSAAGFDPSPSRLASIALGEAAARPAGQVQFRDVMPGTADQRAHLVAEGPPGVDRVPVFQPLVSPFPLTLLTPASSRTINSMFAEFDPPSSGLRVHPIDASARGLSDGDRARMWNDLASLVVIVRIDHSLMPGVVSMPKGLWLHELGQGLTANALISDALSDLAGGATFNDARVEVEAH
jgi:anaerobic selenocysteine-containing dehydrogenase